MEHLNTMRKTVGMMLAISSLLAARAWPQSSSRMPAQPAGFSENNYLTQNWIANAYPVGNGDLDRVNLVFFEIPDTVTSTIYFGVKDPWVNTNAHTRDDIVAAPASGQTLYLIGGADAYTASNARLINYTGNLNLAIASSGSGTGSQLASFSAPNSSVDIDSALASYGWTYFPGVQPSQGEHVGNKYYFRVAMLAPASGSYKNAYQVDVSYSDSGAPTGVSGAMSFAYDLCVGFIQSNGHLHSFYPFVDDSMSGYILYVNYDMDYSGGNMTSAAYDFSNAQSRTSALAVPSLSPNGGTSSSFYSIGAERNGTWLEDITDNTTAPAFNPSELWFVNSSDTTYDAPPTDTILKMYSSYYAPAVGHHVAISPTSAGSLTGSAVSMSIQIVDASGNPVPYVRSVYVTVSGSATISPNAMPAATNAELIATDSSGIGAFTVNDASSESVVVTLATDGNNGSSLLAGTNGSASINFQADLPPTMTSASNTTILAGATQDLAVITIADSGNPNIVVANTSIQIRIPSSLKAAFNTSQVPNVAVTGTGTVGALTLTASVLTIPIINNFGTTDTLAIGSTTRLQLFGNSASSGYLEMSYDNGTTWNVVDNKVITITDPNPTYVWSGGTSESWVLAGNWSGGTAPSANDGSENIMVPNGCAHYPLLPGTNWNIRNLTIDAAASITVGANNLTVAGSISNAGNIILSGAGTISKNDTAKGTVTYSGGGQTVIDFVGVDYYNLSVTGTETASGIAVANNLAASSGTLTLGGAMTVGNAATLGAGATLDLAGWSLTVTASFVSSGTLASSAAGSSLSCAAFTADGSSIISNVASNSISASGAVSIQGTFLNAVNGGLTMSGSGMTLSATPQIGSLTISGTVSLGAALSLAGNMMILGSGSLDVTANNYGITVAENWANSGTFAARAGSVTMNNSAAQTLNRGASAFYALTKSGAGILSLASSALAATNLIVNGGTLALGALGASVGALAANAPVTQATGAITVTGATTIAVGTGVDFTLTNASNDFQGLVSITSGQNVSLSDANGIQLGASTVSGTLTIAAAGSITQTGAIAAAVLAVSDTGANTLLDSQSNSIAQLGAISAAGRTFALNSGVAVSQAASTSITAAGLLLLGSGGYTFTNTGNQVATIAASTSADLSYRDADGLDIGTVIGTATTNGIAVGTHAVTLQTGAALSQSQPLGASSLALTTVGGASLGAANAVSSFTATNNASGAIALVNAVPLTIGAAGISQYAGGTVSVQNMGAVVLSGNVGAGSSGTITIGTGGTGTLTRTAGTLTADTINLQTTASSTGQIGASGTPILTAAGGAASTTLNLGQGSALAGAYVSHTGALSLSAPSIPTNAAIWIRSSGLLSLPALAHLHRDAEPLPPIGHDACDEWSS